jgi:hypothetical protein
MMTGLPCTAVRPSAAPAKDEKSTVIKLGIELSATQGDKPIDSLAEIDRLVSEQDFQLWQ